MARLFVFVSVLWFALSICASFPFWDGWPESFGYQEWVSVALLVPQPVFVFLALAFLRTEPARTITEHEPNPDYDIRKLY